MLVTEEYYERALWMTKNSFHPSDPLSTAIDFQWCDEVEAIWMNTFKENISIMMIDDATGAPMGLRANRKETKRNAGSDLRYEFKDEKARQIVNFLRYSEQQKDYFEHCGTEWCLHFFGLCTADKYRKQGVATTLMKFSMDLARHLNMFPLYVKGEGASNYSKKIYEKLNFDLIIDVPFLDYKENGESVFLKTGEHKSMTTYNYTLRNKDD